MHARHNGLPPEHDNFSRVCWLDRSTSNHLLGASMNKSSPLRLTDLALHSEPAYQGGAAIRNATGTELGDSDDYPRGWRNRTRGSGRAAKEHARGLLPVVSNTSNRSTSSTSTFALAVMTVTA